MSSRTQQTGPPGGGKRNQEQRSYMPTYQRQASNYSFNFRSFPTKLIPVRGWRFTPACCAAHSVLRRGPSCPMPLHRLAWAALNLQSCNEFLHPSASAGLMKTVRGSLSFGVIRCQAAKVVRPNRSLNRTLCGGPGLGFKSLAQTRPAAKCRLASTLKLSYVVRASSLTLLCTSSIGSNFLFHHVVARSPKSLAFFRVCLAGFVGPTAHHFWRVVACEVGVRFGWFLSPAPIRHA